MVAILSRGRWVKLASLNHALIELVGFLYQFFVKNVMLSYLYIFISCRLFVCFHKSSWAYHKPSNISRILVENKTIDPSDVVGASHVGDAPTTSSFPTLHLVQWIGQRQLQDETKII